MALETFEIFKVDEQTKKEKNILSDKKISKDEIIKTWANVEGITDPTLQQDYEKLREQHNDEIKLFQTQLDIAKDSSKAENVLIQARKDNLAIEANKAGVKKEMWTINGLLPTPGNGVEGTLVSSLQTIGKISAENLKTIATNLNVTTSELDKLVQVCDACITDTFDINVIKAVGQLQFFAKDQYLKDVLEAYKQGGHYNIDWSAGQATFMTIRKILEENQNIVTWNTKEVKDVKDKDKKNTDAIAEKTKKLNDPKTPTAEKEKIQKELDVLKTKAADLLVEQKKLKKDAINKLTPAADLQKQADALDKAINDLADTIRVINDYPNMEKEIAKIQKEAQKKIQELDALLKQIEAAKTKEKLPVLTDNEKKMIEKIQSFTLDGITSTDLPKKNWNEFSRDVLANGAWVTLHFDKEGKLIWGAQSIENGDFSIKQYVDGNKNTLVLLSKDAKEAEAKQLEEVEKLIKDIAKLNGEKLDGNSKIVGKLSLEKRARTTKEKPANTFLLSFEFKFDNNGKEVVKKVQLPFTYLYEWTAKSFQFENYTQIWSPKENQIIAEDTVYDIFTDKTKKKSLDIRIEKNTTETLKSLDKKMTGLGLDYPFKNSFTTLASTIKYTLDDQSPDVNKQLAQKKKELYLLNDKDFGFLQNIGFGSEIDVLGDNGTIIKKSFWEVYNPETKKLNDEVKWFSRSIQITDNGAYRELGKVYFDNNGNIDAAKTKNLKLEVLGIDLMPKLANIKPGIRALTLDGFDKWQLAKLLEKVQKQKAESYLYLNNVQNAPVNYFKNLAKIQDPQTLRYTVGEKLMNLNALQGTYNFPLGDGKSDLNFTFKKNDKDDKESIALRNGIGENVKTFTIPVVVNGKTDYYDFTLNSNDQDAQKKLLIILYKEKKEWYLADTPKLFADKWMAMPSQLLAYEKLKKYYGKTEDDDKNTKNDKKLTYKNAKGQIVTSIPLLKETNTKGEASRKLDWLSENVDVRDLVKDRFAGKDQEIFVDDFKNILKTSFDQVKKDWLPSSWLENRQVIKVLDADGKYYSYYKLDQKRDGSIEISEDKELKEKTQLALEKLEQKLTMIKTLDAMAIKINQNGTYVTLDQYTWGDTGNGLEKLSKEDKKKLLDEKNQGPVTVSRKFTYNDARQPVSLDFEVDVWNTIFWDKQKIKLTTKQITFPESTTPYKIKIENNKNIILDPIRTKKGKQPKTANANDIPANDIPANDIPANDIPANDIPANDIPANDIPANDIPANDIPADDIPADDLHVKDLPVDQTKVPKINIDLLKDESQVILLAKALITRASTNNSTVANVYVGNAVDELRQFVLYNDNLKEIKTLEVERNGKKKIKDKQKISGDINAIVVNNSSILRLLNKSTNVPTDRLRYDIIKYIIESYKRLEDLNITLEKAEKKS